MCKNTHLPLWLLLPAIAADPDGETPSLKAPQPFNTNSNPNHYLRHRNAGRIHALPLFAADAPCFCIVEGYEK